MKTLVPLDRPMMSLIGLSISGDLGDYTLFKTRRGKLVAYPRTVAGEPPSAPQVAHRAAFAVLVHRWNAFTSEQRTAYEAASQQCSLMMTGHNLWIHCAFKQDEAEIRTIERLTGQTLERA